MISVNGNLNQAVKATQGNATIIEAAGQAVVNSVQVNIGGGGLQHLVEDVVAFGAKETPGLVDKFGKKLEAIKPKEVPLSSIIRPKGGFYPLIEGNSEKNLLKKSSVKEGLSTKSQVKADDNSNLKVAAQNLNQLKVAEQHLGHFKEAEQNPNGQLKVALQNPPLSVTESISSNTVNQSTVKEVTDKLSALKEGLSTKSQVKDSPNFKVPVENLDERLKVALQDNSNNLKLYTKSDEQLRVALQKPHLSVTDSSSNNTVNQSTVNEVKAKLSTLEQQIIDAQKAQDWDKVSQSAQTMKKLQARLDELNAPVVS